MHIVLFIMVSLSIATLAFIGWGRYDSDRLRIIDATRRHELVGTTIDLIHPKVAARLETCVTTEKDTHLRACRRQFGAESDHVYFYADQETDYFLLTKRGEIKNVGVLQP